jgi:site-specific DNA-methyltransferase (adenine-specific)
MKPYYSENGITIYHGDCRDVLPSLGRFDLLLTDPPYGLGDKWKGDGWASDFGKLWNNGTPDWDRSVFDGLEKIEANDKVIWGGNYYALPPTNSWLLWDKMQKHTGSEAEMAWTTTGKPVRIYRMSRVQAYCGNDAKVHPTQKPVGLMQWCLSFFPDAQTILDPFMGSGTTLLAARLEGRQATGIEINERYCEAAAKRLSQGVFEFV